MLLSTDWNDNQPKVQINDNDKQKNNNNNGLSAFDLTSIKII